MRLVQPRSGPHVLCVRPSRTPGRCLRQHTAGCRWGKHARRPPRMTDTAEHSTVVCCPNDPPACYPTATYAHRCVGSRCARQRRASSNAEGPLFLLDGAPHGCYMQLQPRRLDQGIDQTIHARQRGKSKGSKVAPPIAPGPAPAGWRRARAVTLRPLNNRAAQVAPLSLHWCLPCFPRLVRRGPRPQPREGGGGLLVEARRTRATAPTTHAHTHAAHTQTRCAHHRIGAAAEWPRHARTRFLITE